MKHNIEPVINQYFSCHQIILATYAAYQQRDYEMIFAESWGFKFQKNDQPFGYSLHPGYQRRRNILLEKFHGIRVNNTYYANKENLLEFIKSTLPFSPIMIHQNVYDCPWNMSYRRNHIEHWILINGIDEKTGQLYVLDPYSTREENIITIENITKDSGYIYTFETMEINNHQDEYLSEITNTLEHMKNINFFQNLMDFQNDFQYRVEEVISSEYIDIYAIPIVLNLNRIKNQRYCYYIFLEKLVEKKLVSSSMTEIMTKIAEKYDLLRIKLIKQIIKKKSDNEGKNIIDEIIYNEHKAHEMIKSYV